ncbi:MAG: acylphosphatase [Kofleriaceae bacterium]
MRRVKAIVTGRVQGVSRVELEAEGPDDTIATLLAWCEQGPPAARVERVAVEELAASGCERGFSVVG